MKISRLWPIPVLLFFVYCLHTLVSDSYEVVYRKANRTDPLQFLVCVPLSRVCSNKTEVDLKELRDDLYDHFNRSEEYRFWRERSRKGFELILNLTKSGAYLVLNRKACLIAKDQEEFKFISLFLSFRPVLFAIKNDTFDFVRKETPWKRIEQKIFLKKGPPYSDCDESNGRFLCLNECFRRHFRLARYFYHTNETGRILLHYSESNRTIQESEKTCFAQCKQENCKLVQMTLVSLLKGPNKPPEIFEAQSVLSAFDFWFQIAGLVFSFVGLFFDKFALIITKLTEKLTRSTVRRRKVKVGLFYLNLAIILFSLAYWGYLCVQVALDCQAEASNDLPEKEMTRNQIQQKTVHLAICIRKHTNGIFEKTMSEIEKTTNGVLNETLEGIYFRDGTRSFPADYQVHRKILFKFFGRCFLLSIQPNYQTIPSRPILTIRFKTKDYRQLYVLSEEENLNSKSFEFDEFAFQKRIVKRLKGRCVDYKAKFGNCTGKQNCVDRCIARKFIERYNRTSFGVYFDSPVIDRDWFSPSEWNSSQLMVPYNSIHESLYLTALRQCEDVHVEKACDEVKFKETVKIKQPDYLTMEIDLQLDVVRSVEELPSSFRMALDLLGIQSIFFGFTLLQLLWLVYQFIEPKWKLRHDKVIWFLVCLLCSLGCSWTTVRMLDVIVNGELVSTERYEMAKRVQMPAVVFCLQIDQKLIDRNHRLTGSYLKELTANMTVESTFESILYLNESNEWSPFDLRRVKRFFLLDMKCFRVHINKAYDRNQFHFSGDTQVFRVSFKRMEWNRLIHFMTQSNETAEFSKISNLHYSGILKYSITHERSLYKHEDRFGFFRRHFPSLPEGDVDDLRKQLLELQANEPHRRTLKLPVEDKHFGVEVDEDHFEQLYSAQQKKNPRKRTSLNFRQLFVTNHLRLEDDKFDFSFQLVFLQRVVHFTNEVNYATLTLALLNLLSLWLELGVLDLRPYLVRLHDHLLVYLYLHLPVFLLRKFVRALRFCFKWLKKLESPFQFRWRIFLTTRPVPTSAPSVT